MVARALLGIGVTVLVFAGSCRLEPTAKEARQADGSADVATGNAEAGGAEPSSQREDAEFVRAAQLIEIDLNSGDVKGTRYRADGTTVYGVYESELSKEVRRLGIAIPQEREWRSLASFGSGGTGGHFDNRYREVLPMARRLLNRLDEVNAADEERRDVLEDFMTSLRAGNPLHAINAGRTMIIEIRE